MAGVMEGKARRSKVEFLSLSPLERVRRMNKIFSDMITLKARTLGVKEYEVYRRYLKSG